MPSNKQHRGRESPRSGQRHCPLWQQGRPAAQPSTLVDLILRVSSVTYADVRVGDTFEAAEEKTAFTGRDGQSLG